MAPSGGSGRRWSATALPLRADFEIRTSAFSDFRRLYTDAPDQERAREEQESSEERASEEEPADHGGAVQPEEPVAVVVQERTDAPDQETVEAHVEGAPQKPEVLEIGVESTVQDIGELSEDRRHDRQRAQRSLVHTAVVMRRSRPGRRVRSLVQVCV